MAFDQDTRRTVFELEFRRYPGLTVRIRRPSFGALDTLARAEQLLGVGLSGDRLAGRERIAAWGLLVDAFAESLVGWTLLDAGIPVPATRDGVLAQDYEFLLDVVRTWYARVVLLVEKPAAPIAEPEDEEDDPEDLLAELPVTTLPVAEPAAV